MLDRTAIGSEQARITHTQTAQAVPLESLLGRIRGEFLEMPGMCLTPQQAARLWNVDVSTSLRALKMLVETGFLVKTRTGHYVVSHLRTREATTQHPHTR